MSNKSECLVLEAQTVSALMVQLAENEIDSDSFAVMSDFGENGQEHECDLPITETALRASSIIDQLVAMLEDKNKQMADDLEATGKEFARRRQFVSELRQRAEAAEKALKEEKECSAYYEAQMWHFHSLAEVEAINNAEHQQQIIADGNEILTLERRLQQPIKLPEAMDELSYDHPQFIKGWNAYDAHSRAAIKVAGFKVEGE